MILKTAHVTKYKCVKDSTQFTIDKDVTCLVGKNEAGKTAILEALSKLNPIDEDEGGFDVKFAFFSQYLRMPGQLSADGFLHRMQHNQQTDEDKVFASLLAMIGMTVQEFSQIKNTEDLYARLESTSNKLTKELVRYWSQGEHLKMIFDFKEALPGDPPPFNSGRILRTRIQNTRHGATTSFDQRSSGFVWFFSFLVWFNQLKKNVSDNLVILLDEPGLALHASAQADLLRYIEERLAPNYQVVYTTHSPFMLDPANLLRARTVEDVFREVAEGENPDTDPARGTKVSDQVLRAERATLFPLRACLGYEITQTLFVGKHNVLVEGPSDLLYLDWFRRKLAAAKRTTLDPRWTVVPCGGLPKVSAFMSLFGGNDLHCAVVCDFADGGKKEVEKLRDSELMRADHILTVNTYAGKAQADVEDLIGNAGYVALVNAAYGLTGPTAISVTNADGKPVEGRIVKHVEQAFPAPKAGESDFNHTMPADWLVRQGIDYKLTDEATALDRFEKLFADLNKLLDAPNEGTMPEVVTTVGRRAAARR